MLIEIVNILTSLVVVIVMVWRRACVPACVKWLTMMQCHHPTL
jgi:hypothetical protein